MNRSRIAPFALATLSIASLGVVSTALDSSLSTDPADEVDLNDDRLPIETSDAVADGGRRQSHDRYGGDA